jgi:methionyl-tRNA formyltransferase
MKLLPSAARRKAPAQSAPRLRARVYRLSESVDAGDVAAQEHVFVRPDDAASSLWRRELFPLGLILLDRVLADVAAGVLVRVPQRHELATWEPSIGRPPLFKPELPQLGTIDGYEVVRVSAGGPGS